MGQAEAVSDLTEKLFFYKDLGFFATQYNLYVMHCLIPTERILDTGLIPADPSTQT